jgi:hypothetical protein
MAAGEWTVETKLVPTTNEEYRELRHLPDVVAQLTSLAQQVVTETGDPDLFTVVVQNDPGTQRARALVHPLGHEGIKLELSESVLVKAIASMGGR